MKEYKNSSKLFSFYNTCIKVFANNDICKIHYSICTPASEKKTHELIGSLHTPCLLMICQYPLEFPFLCMGIYFLTISIQKWTPSHTTPFLTFNKKNQRGNKTSRVRLKCNN